MNNVVNGATEGVGIPVVLTFAPAIDLAEPGTYALRIRGGDINHDDTAVIRVFNVDTGLEITAEPFPLTVTDGNTSSAAWQGSGPHSLSVGARIRIEWQFTGFGGATNDYLGWYIDDVLVTETP